MSHSEWGREGSTTISHSEGGGGTIDSALKALRINTVYYDICEVCAQMLLYDDGDVYYICVCPHSIGEFSTWELHACNTY